MGGTGQDFVGRAVGKYRLPSKGQMTGMLGVYLVAAELSRLGFIVSLAQCPRGRSLGHRPKLPEGMVGSGKNQ